jgi:hypothetical protein
MLFKRSHHEKIRRGDITQTYRRWKRPAARVGGRYRLDAGGIVEVTSLDVVDDAAITDADATASGFTDRAAMLRELARYDDGTAATHRVRFRYVAEPDARTALATDAHLTDEEIDAIIARLGRERLPFKADVRKLKALGLTISLDVGYRLSPRGEAVLRRLERAR